MANQEIIKVLLLLARPAAGKSEIIHYLKHTDPAKRRQYFHIGDIDVIDDFPMLWTWFEEDALLSQMGMPRLHTTEAGYFLDDSLWDLLIRRISLEYSKRLRDQPQYHEHTTTLVEFSRGSQHGGYRQAFQNLSLELLKEAAILYVNVSFSESLRKNRARLNPDRPDSILEHGLSDEKMEALYRETDWDSLTRGHADALTIQGVQVPYVVFNNEDDVTTHPGEGLGDRLETTLGRLWDLYQQKAR